MDLITNLFRGVLGCAIMLGILYLMSNNKKNINWRIVGGGILLQFTLGILLQFTLGILVLKVEFVTLIFDWVASFFVNVLAYTNAGIEFLLTPFGMKEVDGALNNFVFKVLPTIVFFSALSSMFYYLGILQIITKGIAWVMSKTMKLTGAESLAAAANVFIGQTEAPLVIRPYLAGMSRSEMMCLMVGGFSTIAGSVFAAYVGFLGGDDPVAQQLFARHLLTASIMSAPAAIVAAKMIMPETKEITLADQKLDVPKEQSGSNILDAITLGATDGFKLAVNVGIMLLVFTALIAMVNSMLIGIGGFTHLNPLITEATDGRFSSLSLEYLLGLIFAPVAWIMGVTTQDSMLVGQLLGMKTAINEFYAFAKMPELKGMMSPKSVIITTYALCGFANFASIGIQIGGISALAPMQRKNLTELGMKAMIGGTIASFLTACIAGMFL
ncbi:MAG: Na+ dependent nucleoside transporter [Saprospiraceae bacterium]|nr:Na+ dependent nucleoside transporter [Saprospiraceae bacterium]MCF8248263.1 Na+ dependent nucleoside transporter [Saprospiraceae bacterium]MCF8279983.1 Na+ dependent nucleoside transporter [Bacteroidales bacterium]MCF8309791.1 Na+ dependent nucleoside transporter [Saprospiraceae bacterium]MCF8438878.1 Na+ dependent nucleoside transporter [Saprospiraceae bacterium]